MRLYKGGGGEYALKYNYMDGGETYFRGPLYAAFFLPRKKKDTVVLVPDLYWLKCCPTFIALKKVHSTACHATGRGKWIRIDAGPPPSPNLILLHCTTTLRFLCPLYTKADRHGIGKGAPIPRSYKHPCLCTHAISGLSPPPARGRAAPMNGKGLPWGGGRKGLHWAEEKRTRIRVIFQASSRDGERNVERLELHPPLDVCFTLPAGRGKRS